MNGRRLRLKHLLAPVAAVVVAGPALAQSPSPPAYPPYPTVRSLSAIATWARRNSDLPLESVVGVGKDSVFSVQRSTEPSAEGVGVVVRQEAISPAFDSRLGGRSAEMRADIDCAGRRIFQREIALYVGSNRQGPSRQLAAAKGWQPIPQGTFMERIRVAVCDPNWRAPYAGSAAVLAVAAPAPSAPIPPPPVPAPSPPPPPPPPKPVAAAPTPPPPPPPAPAPAPASGGSRVELGRFDSMEDALALWHAANLAATGKRLRVELSTAGGHTTYRSLVEGFAGHAEADAFCRSLEGRGDQCRVVD